MKQPNTIHRWVLVPMVAVAVLLYGAESAFAQGCAMCSTLVGGPGDPLGQGMNTSILFLMAMPFAMTGSVGGWIAYMYWRGGTRERGGVHALTSPREEVS